MAGPLGLGAEFVFCSQHTHGFPSAAKAEKTVRGSAVQWRVVLGDAGGDWGPLNNWPGKIGGELQHELTGFGGPREQQVIGGAAHIQARWGRHQR